MSLRRKQADYYEQSMYFQLVRLLRPHFVRTRNDGDGGVVLPFIEEFIMKHLILCVALLFLVASFASSQTAPSNVSQEKENAFLQQRFDPLGKYATRDSIRNSRRGLKGRFDPKSLRNESGYNSKAPLGLDGRTSAVKSGSLPPHNPSPSGTTGTLGSGWTQTNGPYDGGTINCIAVSGANIFAGTNVGVYLSNNNGRSWTAADSGLGEVIVLSLAVSGANLFAGTSDGSVYLSTNNGTSWTAAGIGFGYSSVLSLAVSGSNLFAGTYYYGVCLSTNNGTSWNLDTSGMGIQVITSIAVSGSNLFAGTHGNFGSGYGDGVYLSTNNGTSWTLDTAGMGDQYVLSLAVSGSNLFAGTNAGVYLSTNNGTSWTAENTGLTNQYVLSLAVSGSNIFAGTHAGVYLSTNNGTSWAAVDSGLGNQIVYSLAVSGTNIFAGTDGYGVYLSTNNGTSWTAENAGFGYQNVFSLASSGANIFAGTSVGVYLSTNNGASWTAENTGLEDQQVMSLAVSGSNIFAGTDGNGIYLSTNNGTSWTASGLGNLIINSLAVSGANMFAGTWGYGVYLFTNNGTSEAGSGLGGANVISLAVSGANIFAGTNGGVYLSTDNGTNWTAADSGLGTQVVYSLAVSDTNIFAGTQGNGVYLSTNNGTSWTATSVFGNGIVYSLAVSGSNIFAGTNYYGVYLSTNNGTSWTADTAGMGNQTVWSFAVNGWNIFAGTLGYGVYLYTLSTTVDVSLNSNWNLISIPVQVQDDTLNALFPSHKSNAFGYNGSGYVIDNQLNVGKGYWLKFVSATSDSFVGSPLTFDSVAVTNGWNLIGSLSLPFAVSSITSNPPGMVTSKFFGYTGSYKTTDTLYPGKGYWVKVNNAGTLILSSGSSASLAKNISNSRIRIIPTSEMPPSPPKEDGTPSDLPKEFALEQNYPNPFNPTTTLRYDLPTDSKVTLKIFNVLGQTVATLTDGIVSAGYQSAEWNATNVASGVYFYRIEATSVTNPSKIFTQVKKMVLMK